VSTAFDEGTRPVGVFGRLADLVLTSDDSDQSVRVPALLATATTSPI
jgi:hypothetical protein